MKREDLQGLRGIAIVAVILFHFFPNNFPNGYLGVDLFFVLSGFLMTMILSKSPISADSFKWFYYRRYKRILPSYLLITCIISIAILNYFPSTVLAVNVDAAIKSIMLISNIETSNEMNYYAALFQADSLYTHTWSLSCEMQYYVIVPFIWAIIKYLMPNYSSLGFFIVGSFSLLFHCTADTSTAFHNVFARVWQFSIGSIAYLETKRDTEEKSKKVVDEHKVSLLPSTEKEEPIKEPTSDTSEIVLSCMVIILSFSFLHWTTLDQTYIRILSTLLSGIVIYCGKSIQVQLLTHKSVVFLGDISYSLYLVHWPIYVYCKTFFEDQKSTFLLGIIISGVIAKIMTDTWEKWYLDAVPWVILTMVGVLYIANIIVILYSQRFLQDENEVTEPVLDIDNAATSSVASTLATTFQSTVKTSISTSMTKLTSMSTVNGKLTTIFLRKS